MKDWQFSLDHMKAVRHALGNCPAGLFMGFDTASAKQDMQQATDLVMHLNGGTFAVRVRRRKPWDKAKQFSQLPDVSVRYYCRGYATEIDKLRKGFGDWYFFGWSLDNSETLIGWVVLDINKMREQDVFRRQNYRTKDNEKGRWPVHPNGDGTYGAYIPLQALHDYGCVLQSHNLTLQRTPEAATLFS